MTEFSWLVVTKSLDVSNNTNEDNATLGEPNYPLGQLAGKPNNCGRTFEIQQAKLVARVKWLTKFKLWRMVDDGRSPNLPSTWLHDDFMVVAGCPPGSDLMKFST